MKKVKTMKRKKPISISEFKKTLKETKKPILTLDDIIVLLLFIKKDKPIFTRTLLIKELFLFYKEIIERNFDTKRVPDPNFIEYKYGPFSFPFAETLANLWFTGYIDIKGRSKGRRETFKITDKGMEKAREAIRRIPLSTRKKIVNDLKEKRIGWDQLGRDGILRYVYNMYPEYTGRSKIKGKYKVIKWGQLFEE